MTVTCVVDQYVDAAEACCRRVHRGGNLLLVGDVECERQHVVALTEGIDDGLLAARGGDHVIACCQCGSCDFQADAVIGASDEPEAGCCHVDFHR